MQTCSPRSPPPPRPPLSHKAAEEALAYLDKIRETYKEEPRTYHDFLSAMQEFKAGVISVSEVINRVAVLFRHQHSLYEGFNTFLPPGYGIVPAEGAEVVITTPDGVERRSFR